MRVVEDYWLEGLELLFASLKVLCGLDVLDGLVVLGGLNVLS